MGSRQLFGPSRSEITTASGEFVCPVEQKPSSYEVRRSQRRFVLLGVGVSTGSRERISCCSCGAVFDPATIAGQMRGPAQPVSPAAHVSAAAPASSGPKAPPPAFAAPAPAITPRVIAPGAVVSGQRRVAPPPSTAPRSPVSQAPSAAPRPMREPAPPPVPADEAAGRVAPPPWAAPKEAPAAEPSAKSEINEKTVW